MDYYFKVRNVQVVLLNTPLHGNIGDHAIAVAEKEMLSSIGISVLDYPWEKRYFNPTSFRFQPMEYTFRSLGRVFYPMEFIFYTVERKAYRCFVFQRTSGKMPMSGKITNFV